MASDFTVTLLGTGYPVPLIDRFGPSTLVEVGETRILFDCGRGIMQRIWQIEQNAARFNKLFLTHLHSDHISDIDDLWLTGNICGRYKDPLKIWGPKGTKQMIQNLKKVYEVDIKIRVEHDSASKIDGLEIEALDIDEGYCYEENGVKVKPFKVNHFEPYSDEPSFGYRIDFNGRSVVISGDTQYCENLIQHSKDVDLLIHEVAAGPLGEELHERFKAPLGHHTSPEECGKIFSIIKPKVAVFTHVIQFQGVTQEEIRRRTLEYYDGSVVFGRDMMRIEIGETVRIT